MCVYPSLPPVDVNVNPLLFCVESTPRCVPTDLMYQCLYTTTIFDISVLLNNKYVAALVGCRDIEVDAKSTRYCRKVIEFR